MIIIKWKRWSKWLGPFKVTITANDIDKVIVKCEKLIDWDVLFSLLRRVGIKITADQESEAKVLLANLDLVRVIAI